MAAFFDAVFTVFLAVFETVFFDTDCFAAAFLPGAALRLSGGRDPPLSPFRRFGAGFGATVDAFRPGLAVFGATVGSFAAFRATDRSAVARAADAPASARRPFFLDPGRPCSASSLTRPRVLSNMQRT